MPISLKLLENDRVIYYRVTDPALMSEVRTFHAQNQAIRNQYQHTIHLIVDLTEVHALPSDILSIRHGSPNLNHPRAGMIFIVTSSIYVRSIVDIVARLANTNKMKVVPTGADALSAVREIIRNEMNEISS